MGRAKLEMLLMLTLPPACRWLFLQNTKSLFNENFVEMCQWQQWQQLTEAEDSEAARTLRRARRWSELLWWSYTCAHTRKKIRCTLNPIRRIQAAKFNIFRLKTVIGSVRTVYRHHLVVVWCIQVHCDIAVYYSELNVCYFVLLCVQGEWRCTIRTQINKVTDWLIEDESWCVQVTSSVHILYCAHQVSWCVQVL